jgi:uncharacterized protein DUF5658
VKALVAVGSEDGMTLFALNVLGNVLDVVFTVIGLHGGLHEVNPVMIWLIRTFGVVIGLTLGKLVGIYWAYLLFHTNRSKLLALLTGIVWALPGTGWFLVWMGHA